jgi:glyoxylase I family protein
MAIPRQEPVMPPFRIEQIDHVVLRVHDLQPMLAFYRDVLGCREERRQDEIGLVQLRAGASLIDLVPLDSKLGRLGGAGPGREGHNMDHLCLAVDGYDEAAIVAYLKANGVRVGDIGSRYGAQGEGPSIYCYDPQGNLVELKGPPA